MKINFIILLAVGFLQGRCLAQFPAFTIRGSEVRKIISTNVPGQEYELHIMVPAGYQNSDKKYPVLYLMDSQWDFPLVTALYGEQYFDGFVPPMIIVGITWGGINPNPDSLRARDYTPTNEKRSPQSGGAPKFLSFLKNELIPFIEINYKGEKNDRALMGCSLGGLFTLYALFTEPGLFQRYIAATPAFGWDNEVIYQYEKKYAENQSNPPAKLFACIGGVERSVPRFEKLTKYLSDRHYENLQIKTRILENTGHSGTKGEGYARGLQYVFERPSIKIENSILNKYAGTYSLSNGNVVQLKAENNQLVLYYSPTNKYPLQSTSETDFYSTAEFLYIRFKKDGNKTTTGFELETFGGAQWANKVKQ
jgi:predicted alpha/beta superfamily hydrolase